MHNWSLSDSICFFLVAVWLRMVVVFETRPIPSEECFGRKNDKGMEFCFCMFWFFHAYLIEFLHRSVGSFFTACMSDCIHSQIHAIFKSHVFVFFCMFHCIRSQTYAILMLHVCVFLFMFDCIPSRKYGFALLPYHKYAIVLFACFSFQCRFLNAYCQNNAL